MNFGSRIGYAQIATGFRENTDPGKPFDVGSGFLDDANSTVRPDIHDIERASGERGPPGIK
jgi:hypothetical protein